MQHQIRPLVSDLVGSVTLARLLVGSGLITDRRLLNLPYQPTHPPTHTHTQEQQASHPG